MMIFFKHFIPIALILFCSLSGSAQDNNYVYEDTALLNVDSVDTKVFTDSAPEESENEDYDDGYDTDTTLINNQLSINPDSVKLLKNSRSFGYVQKLDSLLMAEQQDLKNNEKQDNSDSWLARFFLSPFTKYFFWALAIIFILFILSRLFLTEGFFQRSYAKSKVSVLPDEAENLSATTDYSKLIAQATAKGNFRLAVRYHYLQTLQKLSSKGVIQFAADKTNYEYVRELSGKSYKSEFATLTLNYEYVWYGEFDVDEEKFKAIQNNFNQFNSSI